MFQIPIITSSKFKAWNDLHLKYLGDKAILIGDEYGGENYASNEPKTLAGVRLATADWSVHIDHDTWINLPLVEKYLKHADPKFVHCRLNHGYPGNPRLIYPSGPCMIMHKSIREQLVFYMASRKFPFTTGWGDVALGYMLKDLSIPLIESAIPPYHHYVSAKLLARLYNHMQSSTKVAQFENDISREEFRNTWKGGYIEDFHNYPPEAKEEVLGVLRRYYNPEHICLEIGPGGGFWTHPYLSSAFKKVICVDVIEQPPQLILPNIEWHILEDRDYYLTQIRNESIDFVFCFGVFCHLALDANVEYLKSIYRVLKPEGCALVMFANWPQHGLTLPNAKQFANKRHDSTQVNWYYNDIDLTKSAVATAGFKSFENTLPNFRDTLAALKKN
jgi:SAM-dependent methyltransferase